MRLASVRRSLFSSEPERTNFLSRLVNGTRDILRAQVGAGPGALGRRELGGQGQGQWWGWVELGGAGRNLEGQGGAHMKHSGCCSVRSRR